MHPVSIIIPTFNRAQFIGTAIKSVLNQTLSNFELIVVDDGSTDNTPMVVESFKQDILYIQQANKGVSAARNKGIALAKYNLIAFLDSDDQFAPNKLKKQTAAMIQNPRYFISHTNEHWYRRGQFLNQKFKHRKEHGYLFQRCLELCAVGMSTIMARKELFDKVGHFDESMKCCEDYDLWLRTSIHHHFLLVDEPLTIKDGGRADQLSFQYRIGMDRFRIQSIHKLIQSGELNQEQEQQAIQELIKKCCIYGKGCLKHGQIEEGQKYLQLAKEVGD